MSFLRASGRGRLSALFRDAGPTRAAGFDYHLLISQLRRDRAGSPALVNDVFPSGSEAAGSVCKCRLRGKYGHQTSATRAAIIRRHRSPGCASTTSLSHGTAPSQQLAIRLPSQVGHGLNLGVSPAVTMKPGRAECWQVGQIMETRPCRWRLRNSTTPPPGQRPDRTPSIASP